MEVFINRKNGAVKAKAIYNETDGTVLVCKGSIISENVSGGKFKSSNSVIKMRSKINLLNGVELVDDVLFNSASTAANFVTGVSSNGLLIWKNKDGVSLKESLNNMEGRC